MGPVVGAQRQTGVPTQDIPADIGVGMSSSSEKAFRCIAHTRGASAATPDASTRRQHACAQWATSSIDHRSFYFSVAVEFLQA